MFDNAKIYDGMEIARALAHREYEITSEGLHFPRQRVMFSGQFTTFVNDGAQQVDANIVPAEGLAQILKAGLTGTPFYVVPFLNNVTPLSTLTAANFHSTLNEFIAYDEAARVVWTIPAEPAAGVYSNSAAPAVFTASTSVGTGAGVDIWGAGLISASGKQATTGKCACAAKFSGSRNLKAADKLTVQYDMAATSTT